MKKLLYITTIILSIAIIVLGHFHWNSKINDAIANAKANAEPLSKKDETKEESVKGKESELDVDDLTKNLSEKARMLVGGAIESGETIEVALIGSEAQGMGEAPWPELLQIGIDHAYGEGIFELKSYDFGEDHSNVAIYKEKMADIVDSQPDIVLLEPFIMNDNGDVGVKDTIEAIKILERRFSESNEDTVFMLQPSHPIFEPQVYAMQVEGIKEFAEKEKITYLDHWDNWPDVKDEKVRDYIKDDLSGPNDKGNEVWAEYLINYFTGK
ncbi:SGNH/GDSL hydrolase family protein [Bacillus sp. Marseille-Q3570]|uniref:SGNH/GDSL hydrolase family protein n=1 Tax=Bacillus sp. Marseille-Q3570 TaxID=2963522 RepID=UPI0021B6FC26|nr:SGNH/GDSL hydrolase family protein [Bacillus sp. Marseille-Q3570]